MLKSAFELAARCVFLWNLTLYQRQMVGDRSNPFHEMAFISALSSNRLNWRRYYGILKLRRKKEVSSEIPRPPGSTKFNLSLNFHTSIYHVTRQKQMIHIHEGVQDSWMNRNKKWFPSRNDQWEHLFEIKKTAAKNIIK